MQEESYRSRYQRQRRARRRQQLGYGLVFAAVVLIAGLFFFIFSDRNSPADGGDSETAAYGTPQPTPPPLRTDVQTHWVSLSDLTDTRLLELVNLQYPARAEPDSARLVPAWTAVPAQSTDLLVHEAVYTAVDAWFQAASQENAGVFLVASGYRTLEEQAALYEAVQDPSLVQPPGHSEHHTGLAIDIAIPQVALADMAWRPEAAWLAETAWRFGFILRYPEGTMDITGIAYEPWHFRYVGEIHAFYMGENHLVFEQYIALLQERGVLSLSMDGRNYEIWYQTPWEGAIRVPLGLEFTLSGDNRGGYIVTVALE